MHCVDFSPDGAWIASGAADGSLKIWDVGMGKVVKDFFCPEQTVTCVAFNPRHFTIANGSTDRSIKFYDLEKFEAINVTPYDLSSIQALCFCEEEPDLAFACSQDHLKVWNLETNEMYDSFQLPIKPVFGFRVNEPEQLLYTCSLYGKSSISIHGVSLQSVNLRGVEESVEAVEEVAVPLQPKRASDKPRSVQEHSPQKD